MKLVAFRPHAKRPIPGLLLNAALAGIFVTAFLREPGDWGMLWIGLAIVFSLASIMFLVVAVLKLGTTIEIDEHAITCRGRFFRSQLEFADVESAVLAPAPDAQNYRQLALESRDGRSVLIDPRFLNPDRDGIIGCLREGLRSHGVSITGPKETWKDPGSDAADDRRLLSSPFTPFTKRVFPILWLGFLAVFSTLCILSFREAARFKLVFPLLLGGIALLGYREFRRTRRNLVDEVIDDGDALIVRNHGETERIPLSEISAVRMGWFPQPRGVIQLILEKPGRFGTEIIFLVDRLPLFAFTHPIATELEARIDSARSGRDDTETS